jgi:hypothetical protein
LHGAGAVDFRANLAYLIDRHAERRVERFADMVGLKRWTVSRLLHGRQRPTRSHLAAIQFALNIPHTLLAGPHDDFVRTLNEDQSHQISFPVPECIRSQWKATQLQFNTLKGSYIMYYWSPRIQRVVGIELAFDRLDRQGIHFWFKVLAPHHGEKPETKYVGSAWTVADCLYLTAWPADSSLEVVYGILRANLNFREVPTTGRLLFVQSDKWGDRQIQTSRVMLTSLAPVGEDRGRPFRRQEFIRQRTGRLSHDKLDPEVQEFFAAEIANRGSGGREAQ